MSSDGSPGTEAGLERKLRGGDHHYRAFVGCAGAYDLLGALQFNLLTIAGLREEHRLLDIGCGSLRAGRLFIPYLLPERYFGVEPEEWLVKEGIEKELGHDMVNIKRPTFSNSAHFEFGTFGGQFDYLLAHSVFSHASKQQINSCLVAAAAVMKPASQFFATFFPGRTDYEGSEWQYPKLVSHTSSWFRKAASDHGLRATYIELASCPSPTLGRVYSLRRST